MFHRQSVIQLTFVFVPQLTSGMLPEFSSVGPKSPQDELEMASFITTMFVSSPFSPRSAQLLSPTCTLRESFSCGTINTYHCLSEPEPVYYSPATQALRDGLNSPTGANSNARTRGQFKPRNANKGTSSYQLRQFAEATLGSGSLRKAVKLPEGEDLNEWLAVNGGELRLFFGCCSI
jgi:MOB kinase activator 1